MKIRNNGNTPASFPAPAETAPARSLQAKVDNAFESLPPVGKRLIISAQIPVAFTVLGTGLGASIGGAVGALGGPVGIVVGGASGAIGGAVIGIGLGVSVGLAALFST